MSELDIPENAMVTHRLTVTAFIAPSGEEAFSVEAEGETNVSTSVGLLELAKFRLLMFQFVDDGGDDD